jgi:2-polyprenyl-3-methyl-5-hydroxy-6-metoxy-1,4-benzoquinol methylase
MSTLSHWENIYQTKSPQQTSWFEPHLLTSLDWVTRAAADRSAAIIDVGAGESTLVDDLLSCGYRAVTVLDISATALQKSRARLGASAQGVNWICSDVLEAALPCRAYDLWHDRAVFHFLADPEKQQAYLRRLASSLRTGGHAILATFGPQGPEKCSGLCTQRYDADSLQRALGPAFRLAHHALVEHETPFATRQQFLYCDFERI